MTDTNWIKPGALCWYAPHYDSKTRYAGKVSSDVFLCGDTPCVSLVEMDPAYRNGTRNTVRAATLFRLSPRQPENRQSIEAVRRLIEVASQMNIDEHTEEQWDLLAQAVADADAFMTGPCNCSRCGVLIPFDLCVSCQYECGVLSKLEKP